MKPSLTLLAVASSVAVVSGQLGDWCNQAPQTSWTICDPNAAIDDRAADIVSRLSFVDKVVSLATNTDATSSVGLPVYQWWSEATHGIGGVSLCVGKGHARPPYYR